MRDFGLLPDSGSVLDCSCGIGTQAIGLARLGYRVVGTDLSAGEIERARREAQRLGVRASFFTADFRDLNGVGQTFDRGQPVSQPLMGSAQRLLPRRDRRYIRYTPSLPPASTAGGTSTARRQPASASQLTPREWTPLNVTRLAVREGDLRAETDRS